MTVGYARLRGSMGATFCHLAALRSAIDFLFWDHWETAVLGQILAGRSREVTGANFCYLAAPRPPIEFLFWDHWETAVLGQILPGRSREVGGYGGGKRRKVEEWQEKGSRRKPKKMKDNCYKHGENGGKWRNSEAQRRAASVGVRNKLVCKGMRSDTEEGVAEGYKARINLPRPPIEFLFWDHRETAVWAKSWPGGHGRSREQISAIWRPLGRLLNFSSGIIGKRPFWAKSWPGGHGRSWEVTDGYGRLVFGRLLNFSPGISGKRPF